MAILKVRYCIVGVLVFVYLGYSTFFIDAYSEPVVRVLLKVLPAGKSAAFSSGNSFRIWGNPVNEYHFAEKSASNGKNINIKVYKNNALLINHKYIFDKNMFIFSSSSIKFQNRLYDGAIRLISRNNKLYVINFVRLEKYLEGVINAEISSSWHPEAVKAQAVISRTFAMFRRTKNSKKQWDITDSERDQVYKGIGISDTASKKAILATKGQHLRKNNKLIEAFYHSNSGGYTALAENIWHKKLDFVKTVKTPYGNSDPAAKWTYKISSRNFVQKLKQRRIHIQTLKNVRVFDRYESRRAKNIAVYTGKSKKPVLINAKIIRLMLGYRNIKSLLFDIKINKNHIVFYGKGFGHGVGMCQWCAKEMAEGGIKYAKIIDYFYDDVNIKAYN